MDCLDFGGALLKTSDQVRKISQTFEHDLKKIFDSHNQPNSYDIEDDEGAFCSSGVFSANRY